MAKMTPEERAELEAKLAADDDDEDDDDVEVGFGDGSYIKGKFKRVSEAAAARGFKLKADPPADPKDKKPGTVTQGRFQSGRRVG